MESRQFIERGSSDPFLRVMTDQQRRLIDAAQEAERFFQGADAVTGVEKLGMPQRHMIQRPSRTASSNRPKHSASVPARK